MYYIRHTLSARRERNEKPSAARPQRTSVCRKSISAAEEKKLKIKKVFPVYPSNAVAMLICDVKDDL